MGLFAKKKSAMEEKNKKVNAQLREAKKIERSKVKLLLLGAGESGKSTIFKQMRILYNSRGVTEDERQAYTTAVYQSIIMSAKTLLRGAETLSLLDKIKDQDAVELVLELPDTTRINLQVGQALGKLWADPVVTQVWEQRGKLQISDSLAYFMEAIDRISDGGYLATPADNLQVRLRTTGVMTAQYDIAGVPFEMYDVGGQRNERRKWIHCFEDVSAVIFVAALSEYDQPMFEDQYTNRMTEALDLFEEVLALKYFNETSVILFLNKYDLFQEKLRNGKAPIAGTKITEKVNGQLQELEPWKDYTGGDDPVKGRSYFKDRFLARNKDPKRTIFFHITTATDTGNIKFVFDAAKDIILEQNIGDSGF